MLAPAAGLLFLVIAVAGEEPRTWTSSDGRTLQGAYVRVDGDNVVIRMANGEVTVPIDRLVLADRMYARRQAALQRAETEEATGTKDESRQFSRPPADQTVIPFQSNIGTSKPAEEEEEQGGERLPQVGGNNSLKGDREWTDGRGRKLKARFIRMHQGNVVLQARKVESVPFYSLSDADQDFLKMQLEALGQADQIPDRPPPQLVNGNVPPGMAPPVNAPAPAPANPFAARNAEIDRRIAEQNRQAEESYQKALADQAERNRLAQQREQERLARIQADEQARLASLQQQEQARLAEAERIRQAQLAQANQQLNQQLTPQLPPTTYSTSSSSSSSSYSTSDSSSSYGDGKPIRIFIPVGLIAAIIGAIIKFCARASNS